MKKLLLILSLLTLKVQAQQTLTTINGWNAYIHLPWDYNQNVNTRYRTLIFFPGLGEVGTNASAVIANGPGAYITQGWNGNVWTGTDTAKFIIISLQPPSAYPTEPSIDVRIETIKNLYRVDTNRIYLTGLSHGGWCSTTYVTGDTYGGSYYAKKIAAIVNVEGVVPSDNSPYPALWDNYANVKGRLLCFEQLNDFRDMQTYVNRMNLTRPNSAIYLQTTFGSGGHCCWNRFYGGGGIIPQNFLLDGINQNIYQWLAKQQRENVVLALDNDGIITPRYDRIRKFYFSQNTLYLKNVGQGELEIYDVSERKLYSKMVNNNVTLDLSFLSNGIYVAIINQRYLKFIKK